MIVRLTHTARRASVSEADKGVAMDVLNRADLPFPARLLAAHRHEALRLLETRLEERVRNGK